MAFGKHISPPLPLGALFVRLLEIKIVKHVQRDGRLGLFSKGLFMLMNLKMRVHVELT